jgi:putative redox protein
MNTITSKTITPNERPQQVRTRTHVFNADVGVSGGSTDSAPSPHDYFDAALATCKALTASWYAQKFSIPLERVETQVDRDDSKEREGIYKLIVHVELFGPMSDEQRARIYRAIGACPIHKLMTTTDVQIETLPL